MDTRLMSMAGALALATMVACTADDGGSGGSPAPTAGVGATGGIGGGGAGGIGGAGVGGGGAGGAGGAGGVGGAAGAMGGTTGGAAGTTAGASAGSAGTEAGAAGTEAGSAGSAGTTMTGDGGVNDFASCVAAAAADGRTGACPECGCMKCLAEIMNCQDEGCQAVVACGQASGCSGSACYCGEGVDALACAFYPVTAGPSGPCIDEIETASGLVADGTCETKACASPLSMLATSDPDNAVQRARALSICTQGQPFAAATAATPEAPEIEGMCEVECGTADAGM